MELVRTNHNEIQRLVIHSALGARTGESHHERLQKKKKNKKVFLEPQNNITYSVEYFLSLCSGPRLRLSADTEECSCVTNGSTGSKLCQEYSVGDHMTNIET